jgi:hypothetical protein
MVFNCKICDKAFTTEGGLLLHGKVAHTEPPTKETAPPKQITESKKPKKSSSSLTDSDSYIKEKIAKYNAMKKKWPKKATGMINGKKTSKKNLTKLFPPETDVFFNGKLPAIPMHPKLEASYAVTVREMKNEWIAITLTGKRTKVTWKEGPLSKKYRVMIPTMQTK